jgi:hypothetical protein
MVINRGKNILGWLFILILIPIIGVGNEILFSRQSYALAPPRPGEIAELKERGVLESRIEFAKGLGNSKIDDYLLKKAIADLKRGHLQARGMGYDLIDGVSPLPAPPPDWSGMPAKGNIKIFALLIDFPDFPHVNHPEDMHSKIFGEGNPSNFPYESLRNFYWRSSYGLLNFGEGSTLGWYRYNGNRSEIEPTNAGREFRGHIT